MSGFPHSFTGFQGGAAHVTQGQAKGALSNFNIEWSYQIDQLSLVMMFIVTFVGFWIHVFATGYMRGDNGYYRFFSYLNLFMFMMLLLVMGSNFMIMFIGWEGVGLCSYLLIGYYFNKQEAADASKKAFVVNRIGDFGMVLAISGVFATFGTLQFHEVATLSAAYSTGTPLAVWIDVVARVGSVHRRDRQERADTAVYLAPRCDGWTDTGVGADTRGDHGDRGVFMVTRTNFIFQRSVTMMMIVALVGCLTAFIAATIGITQTDIKKVLAYSTVSQLGYMFLGAGVGAFIGAIFHVFTHAFFKALLFLGSGSVIHGHASRTGDAANGRAEKVSADYLQDDAFGLARDMCGSFRLPAFSPKTKFCGRPFQPRYSVAAGFCGSVGFITAGMTAFLHDSLDGD